MVLTHVSQYTFIKISNKTNYVGMYIGKSLDIQLVLFLSTWSGKVKQKSA
jgi:hypothetical protein